MQLVCPLPLFRDTLARLARDGDSARVRLGAGERAGRRAWLCAPVGADRGGVLPGDLLAFHLGRARGAPDAASPSGERGQVHLWEDAGGWQARGRVWVDGEWSPLSGLRLVGPGMYVISMQERRDDEGSLPHLPPDWRLRWARTLRATGEPAFLRLTSLHVGIVGAGRTGSVVAGLIGRLGISKMTLLDPDTVQTHNLGEMEVDDRSCGTVKVHAVRQRLIETLSTLAPQIDAVAAAIDEPRGLAALRACDVVFGCVDSDAARLAIAVATSRRLQVYIDVATGTRQSGQEAGGEIRVCLPGERCILCFGSLTNLEEALRDAIETQPVDGARRQAPRARGVGSLATLNANAAAAAVHLLVGLVTERVRTSSWLRIEQMDGRLLTQAVDAPKGSGELCVCDLAGFGDDELDPSSHADTTEGWSWRM